MPAGEDTIVSKGKASGGMKKPTSGNIKHNILLVVQVYIYIFIHILKQ